MAMVETKKERTSFWDKIFRNEYLWDNREARTAKEFKRELAKSPDAVKDFYNTSREQGFTTALRENAGIALERLANGTSETLKTACYLGLPALAHEAVQSYPYLDNLCDTPLIYGIARNVLYARPWAAAAGSLAAGIGSELLQRTGALSGTYDPQDLAYFTAGALGAYGLEKIARSDIVKKSIRKLGSLLRETKGAETLNAQK